MKISVITACFNAEKTIAECMHSVSNQSYADIEHLIIDAESSDSTLSTIEGLATNKTRIVSEADDGIYFALNKGIELATGDVIGFLHADDIFSGSDVLQSVAKAFAENPVDACYSDLVYVNQEDPAVVVRDWKSEPFFPGMFPRGWMPPHPTFYAKRTVYESFGSFDTSLKLGADWDLLARFIEINGVPTHYVPETWVRMRLGGMSNRSFRNVARNNWETWKKCRDHFGFFKSLLFAPLKWCHRIKQFNFVKNA